MKISKNIKIMILLTLIIGVGLIIGSRFFYKIFIREGFDSNALLTYDSNSPKNSHNVEVVNDEYSCSNFCGPQSQCAITKQQCTSDVDCQGCQPPITAPPKYLTDTEVKPLDDAGKLTWNQVPQYSSLTTDIGSAAAYINKKAEIARPYEGYDKWTKSFNYGLELADKKLVNKYSPEPDEYKSIPVYPTTRSATGLFYDTGPTASNADL